MRMRTNFLAKVVHSEMNHSTLQPIGRKPFRTFPQTWRRRRPLELPPPNIASPAASHRTTGQWIHAPAGGFTQPSSLAAGG